MYFCHRVRTPLVFQAHVGTLACHLAVAASVNVRYPPPYGRNKLPTSLTPFHPRNYFGPYTSFSTRCTRAHV
ncbi:hypothetical protein F5J12DRAFT_820854 [Pisolithus orientalis]|uniref:uncharacterized protein n=1 Tax=Pisolithus orientalis TaxID=936130 RepID=UPI0022242739|nr:uncharacterized protein F5J12DRAFT_820854 [Pisolithus orientalis]KAI6012809.1 hypothetical protein F5J12DRAFT_820854 [Pisolithus orientalis]